MNRLILAALAAGLAGAGVAAAQNTPPSPPMSADSDRDGSVSRAEFLAQAGRHFDAMDTNKDGTLSRDERRAFHEAHRGFAGPGGPGGPPPAGMMPPPPPGDAPPPPPPGARGGFAGGPGAMLQRLDRDGDGKVSRAEYGAPFALLDANKDGVIDQTEATAGPGGGGRLQRLDRDGDGKVSRAEFDAPFDRLDANRDGAIDASEIAAIRARFGGGRFGRGRFGRGGDADPNDGE